MSGSQEPRPAPHSGTAPAYRRRLESLREQARKRFENGATGIQIAGGLSAELDRLIIEMWDDTLRRFSPADRQLLTERTAIAAVGGSGRGEMAPYSDVDLLFLYQPAVETLFSQLTGALIRDFWDAGLKVGHSVRSVRDAAGAARQDIQFATSLVDLRPLCGSTPLVEQLARVFRRDVQRSRRDAFVTECIRSRQTERQEAGGPVLQLEPDIKRSFGGLRDLHLIRWIGFAHYGAGDVDSLRLRGILSKEDARRMSSAQDYLLALRINLHFNAGRPHDVLTRDDQLRISRERAISGTEGLRPVECFMQEYFRHSLFVAEMADRLVARHQRPAWPKRIVDFLMTIRIDDVYRIKPQWVTIPRRFRSTACGTIEGTLRLYLTAARYRVMPEHELTEWIKQQSPYYSINVSPEAQAMFLQILATPGKLGPLLRHMFSTGLLEAVLPPFAHIRCLLQFNQYHSYTVDEHTFRTIEIAEGFETDAGPLGQAYREIRHKEILHLALLLHDAGKGFPEDHSLVGRQLAMQAAQRFQLAEPQRELLVFLVYRHLLMAELAFRRDATDPGVLLNFSHDVGSPETLKLLFVLTAADVSAVGPTVWTSWKAELLQNLYRKTMLLLSGQTHFLEETTRLNAIRAEVVPLVADGFSESEAKQRLAQFPAHYLLSTSSDRIAADLRIIARRRPDEIHVEGRYEPETDTVAYRVITHENVVSGCFHKLTGVLTSQRMEILSAEICTSQEGAIVDSYRVLDHDHAGAVPAFRIDAVADAVRRVLTGGVDVQSLLNPRRRFGPSRLQGPVSNLPMRIVIDNDWSDRYTAVEVFAHDRPGLLYQIARTIFELDLSVARAKISTHFDQVVDAFYVTDARGAKIEDAGQLQRIHDRLAEEINRFEQAALAESADAAPARSP